MSNKMADTKCNQLPDLPTYKGTTIGYLGAAGSKLLPYMQLMRIDRPKGFIYFYLPHLFGSLHASLLLHRQPKDLIWINSLLLVGTLLLRGATCTWNDISDVDFDRQVARTRNRPLPRGAISIPAAISFMVAQSLMALFVISYLPLPCLSFIYAIPAIVGWYLYPLSKRVTNYPQVVLGFPMAWGVFMGAVAMGTDPLGIQSSSFMPMGLTSSLPSVSDEASRSIICLYLANVAWTLCYETIYSFQDIKDDVDAGVKNIALLLRDRAKPFLALLAGLETGLLMASGFYAHASLYFFVGSVFAVAVALASKIWNVDLSEPRSCLWWFSNGSIITGSAIFSGIFVDYVVSVQT